VSVPDAPEVDAPDRSAAPDRPLTRDAAPQPEYHRPRAFVVGPATRLVRGGLFGKAQDGYTGYYMEP
jgi:hypothetical protein